MLFSLSFILIFISSYFITSFLKEKKVCLNIIYFVLLFISQIILNIEVLSLFKAITPINILLSNILISITSFMIWRVKENPKINLINKQKLTQIFNTIKENKYLKTLSAFFIFSSIASLYLVISASTNIDDDLTYHLPRVTQWIQHQTLNHFETNAVRHIQFPINSEILYLWSMIYLKSDILIKFPEYLSYFASLFVLYNYLDLNNINEEKKLWAVFILAGLPAMIIESSSLQTNVFVGALIFASIYLYTYALKTNKKAPIVFAAISYAIAVGTKTTAIFLIPIIGSIFLITSIKELQKNCFKPIVLFLSSSIIAFILLGSYNYVCNFITFNNPIGFKNYIELHSITGGFKTFIANIIRYFYLFIDFSGISQAEILSQHLMNVKSNLFHYLNIPINQSIMLKDMTRINVLIHEQRSTFGILGFALILPYTLYSFYKLIQKKDKEDLCINICGVIPPLFILILSSKMKFMVDMNRYLTTAVILSSPVFIYSYINKDTTKIILTSIMAFNFFLMPLNNLSSPIFEIIKMQKKYGFTRARLEKYTKYSDNINETCPIKSIFENVKTIIPDNSNIGVITDFSANLYPIYFYNNTYNIFYLSSYELNDYNLDDYDYLLVTDNSQRSTFFDNSQVLTTNCEYYLKDQKKNLIQSHLQCSVDFDQIEKHYKLISKKLLYGHYYRIYKHKAAIL